MERKKSNEIYVLDFEKAHREGKVTSTRGTSFLWCDVVQVSESSIFRNATVVKTIYTEFTINEHFDLVDGEWKSFLERDKLGITKPHE